MGPRLQNSFQMIDLPLESIRKRKNVAKAADSARVLIDSTPLEDIQREFIRSYNWSYQWCAVFPF
jgi:hypothetical protein